MRKKLLIGKLIHQFPKILLVMRISILLIVLSTTLSFGNSYAQLTRLSLNMEQATVMEVLEKIELQSEFIFFYQDQQIDLERLVNINLNDKSIEEVMDVVIKGTSNTYRIRDRQIIIAKDNKVLPKKYVPLKQEDAELELLDDQKKRITGTVTDGQGAPLPGVSVVIEGTTNGTATSIDGEFSIEVDPADKLVFSFIGLISQTIPIGTNTTVNVQLQANTEELDDVVVVGFGTQKKKTVVGSMSTVKPSELKMPTSNLTTALAGRVAGIISYQTSGEPGQDNAQFFVRGVTTFGLKSSPLILIDGVELTTDDLARLNPDDIESFSILKDATSTAIYGARGANGIIMVTTKSGVEGKIQVSARFENSFSMATKDLEMADPITYLKLHNEAVRTRDPLGILPYSQSQIDNTLAGGNPNVYPTVDWQDLLLKDYTSNQRFNFNIKGGGKVARYYVAASYTKDNGVLKVDNRNNFNNNIDLTKYLLRANIDLTLGKTTEAKIRLHSTLDDYTGPLPGGTDTYNMIMRSNPVRFPAYYEPDEANKYTEHILFGNDESGNFINPYAELVKGFKDYSRSMNMIQIEVHQDLSFVTPGLRARFMGNNNRTSYFTLNRSYNPFYYKVGYYDKTSDVYGLELLNENSGTEYLAYEQESGQNVINTTLYGELAVNYDRQINEEHGVSGLLVAIGREYLNGNAKSLQLSLPSRNLGLSGRFTYSYSDKYFAEFNFGFNGSERFAEKNRFGFFPSFGAGWLVSSENFWSPDFFINHLKIRGSYGTVGNDAIGSAEDRFFYLSQVNLDDGDNSSQFGTNYNYERNGVSIDRYSNPNISWETATKSNLGIELNMWDNAVTILADVFSERRTNILQERSSIPSVMGLQAPVRANVGEASSHGVDFSIDANKYWDNGLWLSGRINYTYATNKYEVFEEPDYDSFGTPWVSKIGRPIKQEYGLIAERLFVDDLDVYNSPRQDFGEVMGGDIKYKDINGDGIITDLDKVPIGTPSIPEITYGFGFSMGYKKFDLSAFFQGLGNVSFFIDPTKTTPFADTDDDNSYLKDLTAENGLLKEIADDHWSEDNRNLYAFWPRLSTYKVGNNAQNSTWWQRDGSFLRLKQLELGYSVVENTSGKRWAGMSQMRIYASGTNLMYWSKFNLWDPEMKGNGMGYPLQKVINLGVQVTF